MFEAYGPNGVPSTVYKRCSGILNLLWKVLRTIWRRGRVADQWRQAEGVWIPKEEKSKEIDQFRIISLLNTEGKIFFSILSRRLSKFLIMNEYPAVRVFANGPGDLGSIPGRVIPKTLKMELDTTLLNTQHYKVRFKGKVEQSWEWSSALPYTLV